MPRVIEGMFAEGEKPVDPREPLLAQTRENKNELDELFAGMSGNISQQQGTSNLQQQPNQQEDWSEVWEEQKRKQLDESRTAWAQQLWEQQKDEFQTLEKHYDDVLSPQVTQQQQLPQQSTDYPTWNGLGQAPEFYKQAETYEPTGGLKAETQEETPLLKDDTTQQQSIESRGDTEFEQTNEALPTWNGEGEPPEFYKKAEIYVPEGGVKLDDAQLEGMTNEALPTWNGPGPAPEFYKEAETYTPTGGEKVPAEDEETPTFTEQVKEKAANIGASIKETAQDAGHKIEEWKDTAFEKTGDVKDGATTVLTNVATNVATHVKDAAMTVGHAVADTFNKLAHRAHEKMDEAQLNENNKAIVENKENINPELTQKDEFVDSGKNANLQFAEGIEKGQQLQSRDSASRRFC